MLTPISGSADISQCEETLDFARMMLHELDARPPSAQIYGHALLDDAGQAEAIPLLAESEELQAAITAIHRAADVLRMLLTIAEDEAASLGTAAPGTLTAIDQQRALVRDLRAVPVHIVYGLVLPILRRMYADEYEETSGWVREQVPHRSVEDAEELRALFGRYPSPEEDQCPSTDGFIETIAGLQRLRAGYWQ